jgi:hypothetical protein
VEDSHGRKFTTPPFPAPTLLGKITLPPVIVPWAPGGAVFVDGHACWTPVELISAVADKAFGATGSFELVMDAKTFPQFGALVGRGDDLGQLLLDHAPGYAGILEALESQQAKHADPGALDPGTVTLVLGIYLICVVGGTMMILAVGVTTALILGLALGYNIDFGSDTAGDAPGTLGQKYRIKFTKPSG